MTAYIACPECGCTAMKIGQDWYPATMPMHAKVVLRCGKCNQMVAGISKAAPDVLHDGFSVKVGYGEEKEP